MKPPHRHDDSRPTKAALAVGLPTVRRKRQDARRDRRAQPSSAPRARAPAQRLTQRTGGRKSRWFVAAATVSALFSGTATPGAAEGPPVCVTVDPVFAVGCPTSPPAAPPSEPGSTSTAQSEAPASANAVERSSTAIEFDPRRIAVLVQPRASLRALTSLFARAGVQIERAVPAIHGFTLHVAADHQRTALRVLRTSPLVTSSRRDVLTHALDTTPNDTDWPFQSGLRVVGLPRAWDITRGSPGITVAVVDTGVDPNQPDLQGALVPGANFVDPAAPPRDDNGHGTAVAAIIAARTENHQGIAGICWFCSVMPVKVLDRTGAGDDSVIAAGVVWAADHGAQVINMSLGGPGDSPELAAALAYASGKGAIVTAAAGNSSTDAQFFPAADPNALSVAGTTTADHAYVWSNFGRWVDVAAPGCNIAPLLSGGYGTFCGTSSATPVVAGIAALALSARASGTAAEVEQALEQTATPVPGFVHFGRVNAADALGALLSGSSVVLTQTGTLDRVHRARTYVLQAGPGPLTATATFAQNRRLTLALFSVKTGSLLGQVTGSSPLRLSQAVSGPVRVNLGASDRRAVRFRLTLAFSRSSLRTISGFVACFSPAASCTVRT
jgi:subtilisin family serine protease